MIELRFADLGLDRAVEEALREQGFEELYPPQESALPIALRGENLVLAVPTASGKSLVAHLAILRSVLAGGKAIYIVPLRALAYEKFEELRRFERLGVRTALSMGDYDAPDPTLGKFNVIVATSEKVDSLLRHRISWLEKVSVVVADEVHLMNDPDRGPTLEVTLSKFRMINPGAQIVALSATIKNAHQLAEWLNASLVTSDWRPVPLKEGVYLDGRIYFSDNTCRAVNDEEDPVVSLVSDCLSGDGQVLVFVNTRRASESLASALRATASRFVKEPKRLRRLKRDVALDGEEQTSVGRRLSSCITDGVAFHNAGLTNDQRRRVEEGFREGAIRCIVATPTLAAGINLPARMVVVREAARYDANFGYSSIPVLEMKQMFGRAGRPKYDDYGEAVLVAKDEEQRSFFLENYLLGEPEEIFSKLGTEPALRSHVLAAVATGMTCTESELGRFFEHTFLSVQTDLSYLDEILDRILMFLEEAEMVGRDADGRLRATFFGRRVSDLYLDPGSAVALREALQRYREGCEFGVLHALASTTELQPLYLRQKDYDRVEELLDERRTELLLETPEDLYQYEFFLADVKTAALIDDWIGEKSEEDIEKRYGIGPGDIRNKMEIAEWMAHCMDQLSAIFRPEAHPYLDGLVRRISYGIKEELLELVKLKNIGRVRARTLFNSGIRTISDLRGTTLERLSALPGFGITLAAQIKRELGQERAAEQGERMSDGQSMLSDFSSG